MQSLLGENWQHCIEYENCDFDKYQCKANGISELGMTSLLPSQIDENWQHCMKYE